MPHIPEISRRDFLKLAGVGVAAVAALDACAPRPKGEPFVNFSELDSAHCGIAMGNFSAPVVDIYIAPTALAAGDFDRAFESEGTDTRGMETYVADQSYHTVTEWWKVVDHDTANAMLNQLFVVRDIRFSQHGPTLVRVTGNAPAMVDGKPSDQFVPTDFVMAIKSGGPWAATITASPLCTDDTSDHVANVIRSIESRVQQWPDVLYSDEPIFEAAIVPKQYKDYMVEALLQDGLENAINKIRGVTALENITDKDLFVSTFNADGIIQNTRLPMGLKVGVEGIHELSDGRVLALVAPRQDSFLIENVVLIQNAKNVLKEPLWMDITELWVKPGTPRGVASAATEQMNAQGTPTMNSLDRRLATLQPTQTDLPAATPRPTETPVPTYTVAPTTTEVPDYTGVQAPTIPPGLFGELPAAEPVGPSVPQLMNWGWIPICGIGLVIGGVVGWVAWDMISFNIRQKLALKASDERFTPQPQHRSPEPLPLVKPAPKPLVAAVATTKDKPLLEAQPEGPILKDHLSMNVIHYDIKEVDKETRTVESERTQLLAKQINHPEKFTQEDVTRLVEVQRELAILYKMRKNLSQQLLDAKASQPAGSQAQPGSHDRR